MKYLSLSIPGPDGKPLQLVPPSGVPTGGLSTGKGNEVLGVAIELVLIGAIFLSLFFIIRGGINISTSGGDKEKFQKGRERIRYALIGLMLIFLSFFFLNVIGKFFGINLLNVNAPTPIAAPTPTPLPQCLAPSQFTCTTQSSTEIRGDWKNPIEGGYRLIACEELGFKDCVNGDLTSDTFGVARKLKPKTKYILQVRLESNPYTPCSTPGKWSNIDACVTNP